MLLTDINFERSYRSNKNNMVKDFYNPVLSTAVLYKRAVGYFTVSSLINAAQGLSNLIENGGRVEIIASPKLSEDDINTINLGYKMKSDVILDAMIREFNSIESSNEKEKLNYISGYLTVNPTSEVVEIDIECYFQNKRKKWIKKEANNVISRENIADQIIECTETKYEIESPFVKMGDE